MAGSALPVVGAAWHDLRMAILDQLSTRAVTAIVIYCPCALASLQAFVAGDADALEHDPAVARMIAIIRAPNALGDFGVYQGVIEIGLGVETFIATAAAQPTLGTSDTPTWSPTVTLTTYVDQAVAEEDLERLLRELIAAHPWEVPVIEVRAARLAIR